MLEKLSHSLTEDVAPLLPVGVRFNDADAIEAFDKVWKELITRMKGDAWRLTDQAVRELRSSKFAGLQC